MVLFEVLRLHDTQAFFLLLVIKSASHAQFWEESLSSILYVSVSVSVSVFVPERGGQFEGSDSRGGEA